MPSYVLSSGISFETVIIPKGTVLFHGFDTFNVSKGKDDQKIFMYELFGWPDSEGDLCINPHHNMFFYASPYVIDIVNRYKIHSIFLTNYDLEIISMINPSKNTHDKKGVVDKSAYLRCTEISELNKCGYKMEEADACLSPLLLAEFPHIAGYIAIAGSDGSRYKSVYYSEALRTGKLDYVKESVPFVVENARGLISIPEIVLYPYHARINLEKRTVRMRSPINSYPMNYAIEHRAELNYFPFAYITEDDVYFYNDIMNDKIREKLTISERMNGDMNSPIVVNTKKLLDKLLSPEGLIINGHKINFTIDLRTGFYVCKDEPDKDILLTGVVNTYRSPLPLDFSEKNNFIVPFKYPADMKRQIHGYLASTNRDKYHTEEDLVWSLNRLGASFSRYYQFKKDHPEKYILTYKLEKMFPRPDLDDLYYRNKSKTIGATPKRRVTRKKNKIL